MSTCSALTLILVACLAACIADPVQAQTLLLRGTLEISPAADGGKVLTLSIGGESYPYEFVLSPQRDAGGQVIAADLILRPVTARSDGPNLLEPEGPWYGLQPFMFVASDLALGGENTAYGVSRYFTLKQPEITVSAAIVRSVVEPSSGNAQSTHTIRELMVELAVTQPD